MEINNNSTKQINLVNIQTQQTNQINNQTNLTPPLSDKNSNIQDANVQDKVNINTETKTDTKTTINNTNINDNINSLNNPNEQVAILSSMIENPFTQNPFYQNPMMYNNPYFINSAYYDSNINTVNNSSNLWKYLLVGGLGLLTGAALSSMMFYSYPLYYPMYYSYYYSPCWYNFFPYMWW
ncbi:MAG: hypothetical protein ACPL1F_04295 [bacterium]